MRCQYCGKRLPLFRKLKDGEFCSTDHREQFHAQNNELAVASLRQQRERTKRAQLGTKTLRKDPAANEPGAADGFCDRYLTSAPAAMALGQLAAVALEPATPQVRPFMPERPIVAPVYAKPNWDSVTSSPVPADQVLHALNYFGASPELVAESAAATIAEPVISPREEVVPTPGMIRLRAPEPLAGPLVVFRDCAWIGAPLLVAVPALQIAPETICRPEPRDATAMAAALPLRMPAAHALITTTAQQLASQQSTIHRAVWGACALWMTRQPDARRALSLLATGLEALPVDAIAPAPMLAIAGPAVRFHDLTMFAAELPDRMRPALRSAPRTALNISLGSVPPQFPNQAPSPLVSATGTQQPSCGQLGGCLRLDGELADLIEPRRMAPAQHLPWRFEACAINTICTLAVRPLSSADGALLAPPLSVKASGPRRGEQQLRLPAPLRPLSYHAPLAESMTFELEPAILRPRLRAQPDPARRPPAGFAARRGNQGDAAVESIKIPVLRRFWAHAPADIRWVALVIPLVLFLVWYSWTPDGKALNKQAGTAELAVDTSGVQTVLASFKSRISSRAAVELGEDFRAGLGMWQGARADWAENWAYDQAGFVRPGSTALFTPTVALTDYNFEFMGQIEDRAMSWVYRAKDLRNYYQGKLVILRNGPMPEVALVRSIVKNGREVSRKQIVMAMNLRPDTLYRVRVEVNGSDFTTSVLGQVVDTFTDGSHAQGGVGFYGGHGETSRIRWVEVSHQYDTIGRLCAMLVPYGMSAAPVKPVTQ